MKITGLSTPTQTENRYPGWVVEVRKKTGADAPTPYQTPGDLKRSMTTDEWDAALGAELGAEAVIDPLASPAPRSSPGPRTPPQFMDADMDIPSIALPAASPVTHTEDQLLETNPDSPMLITSTSTSTVTTPVIFEGTQICRELHQRHPYVRGIKIGVGDPTPGTWTRGLPLCT